MPLDSLHIWKSLSDDRRISAATAFYADENLRDFHRAADAYIGRLKNFRPQFVKKLSVEKRASYLAHLAITSELAGQLIVSYHFAYQRPMMSEFLNALGIANESGLISDDASVSQPTSEQLDQAVAAIRSSHSPQDVELYLSTLISQNEDSWGALAKHLPQGATV